ncbi:MAG: SusD/RagB family nutrient-binding outer membrane lipoprotein [Marivirga sp.]|nr:SusD/RagB family nutrient-binding outer membrane lipoprotein [Marivirga sp.]
MKRKRTAIFFLLMSLIASSCQDELSDRYLNPDKTTTPTIDKFFTSMLNNNRVRPSYWEVSTFVNWHIGVYTQSVGFLNSESIYQQNESYIQDRWNDFYRPSANGAGVMAHFREIERTYSLLSEEEKASNLIFLRLAQVVLLDQLTQMVDLWGDVPFSEAGMLNKTGDIVYPQFDDSRKIYNDAIEQLREIAEYLSSAKLSQATQLLFSRQDILLGGNLDQWRRYTNALRLRLLMRISFVDEASVRNKVMTLLGDEDKFPLLKDLDYDPSTSDILLTPLESYTDDLHAAFADWTNYPAPYFMLEEVLKPSRDPRIPVLFDKFGTDLNNQFSPNEEYRAMPLNLSRVEQQAAIGKYAIIDSTTFLYNSNLPGVVMTTAEVNFLKAEAFQRWGGGDAASEYRKGIMHSIEFYYYLNSLNTTRPILDPPSQQEIESFLNESSTIQFEGDDEGKLSKIWTQKWVHFGFLQATQRWAEQRRTTYPKLEFFPSTLSGYELPPTRLTYPSSERTFNSNYQRVVASDQRNTKLFWDVR